MAETSDRSGHFFGRKAGSVFFEGVLFRRRRLIWSVGSGLPGYHHHQRDQNNQNADRRRDQSE